MKKYFLLSLIFLLSAGTLLFAEAAEEKESEEIIFNSETITQSKSIDTIENEKQISRLIARSVNINTLKQNKEAIFTLAQDLDEESKRALFEKYKSDAEAAKKENIRAGYGLGSLGQGDFAAFLPHALIDGFGSFAFYGGLTFLGFWTMLDFCTLFMISASTDYSLKCYIYGGAFSLGGAVIMISSRLISMIHPYKYAEKFNAILTEALDLNDDVEKITLAPILIPDENLRAGMAISMKLK